MADWIRSGKAVLAGYIIGVVLILVFSWGWGLLGLAGTPLAGVLTLVVSAGIGGFAAARVTQRFRIVTAAIVGAVMIVWALYTAKSAALSWVQLLPIAAAAVGGWLAVRSKPVVRDNERI
ncbi:hypothetical protein B5M42_006020 [Paenibacillus athensensis]|uniref:Uncharacterized protein n=1 Tax=Paenibacillus athensensis TaxID=1967502 RepID=A0A4Y8Q3L9_9BACL|nr:hypothetical protein [Paenibacillus athensensis]MCD1258397.1 hypothetical protein [Paenibacillus athensensis]